MNMKNILLSSLLVVTCFFSVTASSALYKGFDADGNVTYSDTPFEDAKRFVAPPISVVDSPNAGADEKPEGDKPAEFKYTAFDIVSPVNKQTIRNDPDIGVVLSIKPELNTEQGHSIWMLVDGKPVVEDTQSLSLQLGRLNRGAHQLQAEIKDAEGKTVVQTRVTLIFLHNTIK
jgi:hypothetical protein